MARASKKAKRLALAPKKRCFFHCLFHFKLSLQSRLVLGSQVINWSKKIGKLYAKTPTKDSTAIRWVVSSRCARNLKLAAYEQDLFFFWGTPHISFFTWISIRHFPLCKCKQNSFSRHCNARLSAVKVWDIIENRACAAVVHGFSKPRTTFECIYSNLYEHLQVQGKPRLG